LLLDTHAILWYALNDPKLCPAACALILDPQNQVFMSPASYWEIAVKVSIRNLTLHQPFEDFIDLCQHRYGFRILPIEPAHAARLLTLPFPPHHKDPFDRLLVAQTIVEQMSLFSDDQQLDAYPIQRLWN
jgi:PIN domain nuclease of toxin-antitoxin system